jgi:hypothetical protein
VAAGARIDFYATARLNTNDIKSAASHPAVETLLPPRFIK